jgi:pyruvate dehydrogenase E2 component (dihydrolipoamide acetyltransferase)
MAQTVIMPKLGLTMTHGKITRWLKKEGDRVEAGEVVVEIETDKISSEVESPVDGVILHILAHEGEEKEITTPICVIVGDDEQPEEQEKTLESMPMAAIAMSPGQRIFITPVAKKLARDHGLDYSGVHGTGPQGRIVKKDILKHVEGMALSVELPGEESSGRIRITPVAKKIAHENGISYTRIQGTGPDGRIVKEDILAAVEAIKKGGIKVEMAAEKTQSQPDVAQSCVPVAAQPLPDGGIVKKAPLAGVRKVIAARLSQSKHDIPHVYFKISVDAGNILELKNKAAETVKVKTGKKLSLNDIIIKAAAAALEELPDINVSLQGEEIIYYRDANIGIAVNTDRGLVVPVIRGANRKSLSEISKTSGELIDKARSGKLTMEDMTGGTFTISNLGAYHIDEFSAIINPPESAILAVGRAAETPCVRDGQIVIRPMMNLTVSIDHRVIDGAQAAQFMKRLKDILEDPYLLLI